MEESGGRDQGRRRSGGGGQAEVPMTAYLGMDQTGDRGWTKGPRDRTENGQRTKGRVRWNTVVYA